MRRPDMAGKISFLRRMRRTIGYTGRYLFPCPFSAGPSPLFSSALVTSFPSSPYTVISFFLCPDQPLSFLSGNRRFFPSFSASFLLSVIVSTAPLCLSSAHFYLTFSPPAPNSSCLYRSLFPFSFLRPCHIFTAFSSPAVISPLLRSPPSAAFPPLPLSPCDTKNLIFV